MALIKNFPLLVIPLILYNVLAFNSGGAAGDIWAQEITRFSMISGADFVFTRGGLVITVALAFLFIEILKATRTAQSTILDHLLSTVVFIVYLIQFIVDGNAATTTYFICALIAFLDVVAGYSISIRVASRDFTVGG